MAPPTNFKIRPPGSKGDHVNDFVQQGYLEYEKDPEAFLAKAHAQWKNLKETLESLGASIVDISSDDPEDDMVFTADPSLSFNKKPGELTTIFSRFSNVKRAHEATVHAEYFEASHPEGTYFQSHFRTEGTGDNIYDPFRDVFWSGYASDPMSGKPAAGRSDKRAHKALAQATGVEVVSLNVKAPFFHIDTSLGPLTNGHVLCFPGGMHPDDFELMKKKAFQDFGLDEKEYLIEVSKEDAEKFACNVRCIGNTVVIPECSNELKEKIESKGYKVMPVDLSCFIAAGGAVHCLTNNINETRVVGGHIAQNKPAGPEAENI